jgi:hypothetical protein
MSMPETFAGTYGFEGPLIKKMRPHVLIKVTCIGRMYLQF